MKTILTVLPLVALLGAVFVYGWLLAGGPGVALAAAVLSHSLQCYETDVPRWSRLLAWPVTVIPWALVMSRVVSGWRAWLLAGLAWGLLIYLDRPRGSA
jgi:hypothetical protein